MPSISRLSGQMHRMGSDADRPRGSAFGGTDTPPGFVSHGQRLGTPCPRQASVVHGACQFVQRGGDVTAHMPADDP